VRDGGSASPKNSVDLKDAATAAGERAGVIWTLDASSDLNANLVRFSTRQGVGEHVNDEVEVSREAARGTPEGSLLHLVLSHIQDRVRAEEASHRLKGVERQKERGDIEGLVTPTDVLEALVGDLEESGGAPIVQRGDGSWLVDGLMNVDELGELLVLRGLPDGGKGDYQTVGGMVMSHLGRVPAAGDRFDWREFSFEVVDMDGHRVDKVLVTRAPGPTTADDAPQGDS
jgi:putative hemolysin